MKLKEDKFTVGVIVGRFQCHELHEAHKELIQTVLNAHPKVLIFLGLSAAKGTTSNPFGFQPRKQMIQEIFPPAKYPNLTIHYIKDVPSDEEWSKTLDKQIKDICDDRDSVVLYGSRDSFVPYYKGKFTTRELASERHISGTEIRSKLAEAPQSDPLFRAGAIWATFQRYPTVFTTVDVAIIDVKENKMLLARKTHETKYRFVGGFADTKSESFEADAAREVYEETTLVVNPKYIGSVKIDDWRYRSEVDKIKTLFYVGYYNNGAARAQDDIAEVRHYDIDKLTEDVFVKEHIPLFKMFKEFWKEEKRRFENVATIKEIVKDTMVEQARVGGIQSQLKRN